LFGDRREVLVPAGVRREHAGLEFEPVMRLQGVVQLDADRTKIPVFRDDVMVRVAGNWNVAESVRPGV